MKILITGGAGFIGSHLARKLSKNNKIIVVDNNYRINKNNSKDLKINNNITFFKSDIRKKNFLKPIKNIDIIYHLAAQSSVMVAETDKNYTFETNIKGTYNVLNYALKNKIKKVVFSSSREVYGIPKKIPVDENNPLKPINVYGASKLAGETICKAFSKTGIDIFIVRLANVYGKGDFGRVIPIFLDKIKRKENLTVYGGKQILDFIWIDEIVDSLIKIPKNKKYSGIAINIGSGKGITIMDLAKKIKKLTKTNAFITLKKLRDVEVDKYVSKSNYLKLKTIKLDTGLKKLLN